MEKCCKCPRSEVSEVELYKNSRHYGYSALSRCIIAIVELPSSSFHIPIYVQFKMITFENYLKFNTIQFVRISWAINDLVKFLQ